MKKRKIISSILLFFAFFFVAVTFWVPDNFGNIGMSQIVFHLKVPMEGSDSSFIIDFALKCVILPLILSLFIICMVYHKKRKDKLFFVLSRKDKEKEYRINPLDIIKKFIVWISIGCLILTFHLAASTLELYEYLNYQMHNSTIFEDYYVDPMEVTYQFPETKRNLIYIYLESMETTYYSKELGGAQKQNLIPELYHLAQTYQTFDGGVSENTGFYVPEGTGWTIGAMVGQSAGIPLKIAIQGNSYSNATTFLPGSYSIGEILEKENYNQTLLIGSEAEFGGRENFYKQHGNYNIVDYNTAIDNEWIPADYHVWWGYEDEKLYEFAKNEILNLSTQDKPFNFTMLTADTHHIGGYPCPLCNNQYDNQYSNVIACASRQVNNFVSWIQEQDFYENTTIVICGDHTSMDPDFFTNLDDDYIRKGYYVFINSAIEKENNVSRKITTFDLFPTTLASLGVNFDENRLGLGTNLYSDEQTLIEIYGFDVLQEQLSMNSKYYDNYILYGKEKE